MKKLLTMCLLACFVTGAGAQDKKDTQKKNVPVFTTVKENPITSIKDQNRSGTCWAYSTLSFLESEILKATGKTYNLCEMFIANKDYMDRAIVKVRMHGDSQFSQGGSFEDVVTIMQNYGICPEEAMPAPGTLTGDSLANFGEFFTVMEPYVDAIAKTKASKISKQWRLGLQGILDAYLGKCPEKFVYEGKEYTPKTFAQSLGINLDDYVSITSYTHHPFYTQFALEIQDNWRWALSYNVPMEELMAIIDNAVNEGYTVAWGGDVTEDGFTRTGLGLAYDVKKARSMAGTDADRWFNLSATEKRNKLDSLGVDAPEIVPTQEMRQEAFDSWETTDDHGMHLYGIAKDKNGREYYMVKNSWGNHGDYKGIWYMSKNYVAYKTMNIMVNKNAIPKDIRKKLGI